MVVITRKLADSLMRKRVESQHVLSQEEMHAYGEMEDVCMCMHMWRHGECVLTVKSPYNSRWLNSNIHNQTIISSNVR